MDIKSKLITCFKKYKMSEIDDKQLIQCLKFIAKKVTGKNIPVYIDPDYFDIFNNINLVVKNNKFVLDDEGIVIGRRVILEYTPEMLAAAFLCEVGYYEIVTKNPDAYKYIMYGWTLPVLSPLAGLYQYLIEKSKKHSSSGYKLLVITFTLTIILSFIVYVISRIKDFRIKINACGYVRKYGLIEAFDAFISVHERPSYLYVKGLNVTLLSKFVSKFLKDIDFVIMMLTKALPSDDVAALCKIVSEEIDVVRKYGIKNYQAVRYLTNLYTKKCLRHGRFLLPSELKRLISIYSELSKYQGG